MVLGNLVSEKDVRKALSWPGLSLPGLAWLVLSWPILASALINIQISKVESNFAWTEYHRLICCKTKTI